MNRPGSLHPIAAQRGKRCGHSQGTLPFKTNLGSCHAVFACTPLSEGMSHDPIQIHASHPRYLHVRTQVAHTQHAKQKTLSTLHSSTTVAIASFIHPPAMETPLPGTPAPYHSLVTAGPVPVRGGPLSVILVLRSNSTVSYTLLSLNGVFYVRPH
jgi:hypothetical protein